MIAQGGHLLALQTPLGDDALVLQRFEGVEELSRPFHYALDMISNGQVIDPNEIVGKSVTFSLQLGDESTRYFNGVVRRFVGRAQFVRGHRCYRAEVVPALWMLTRASDCRVFQERTLPQIVEEVLGDFGISAYELDLQGKYSALVYTVQYRETAFDFLSRLLEEHGVFYWFRHENGAHTLMLADHVGAYVDCAEQVIEQTFGSVSADHITDWDHRFEFRSGKVARRDYNFETPRNRLQTASNSLVALTDVSSYELFDYPGRYQEEGVGDGFARIRMEEEEVHHDVVEGKATCRSLHPAGKFRLSARDMPDEDGKQYVVTRVAYTVADETHAVVDGNVPDYRCEFTSVPSNVVFRPARNTPRPFIGGLQTAVVVGPDSEEIFTDKYGRVKVQFHWDRHGAYDDNSSCWIRVSQNRAGRGWGEVYVPHPGHEVIVSFLEGDPDCPIITGRLYNADNMPPVSLPAGRTQLAMRDQGGNFMTMQGAGEEQQIVMYSPSVGTRLRMGK